jgi:hypothetical protein
VSAKQLPKGWARAAGRVASTYGRRMVEPPSTAIRSKIGTSPNSAGAEEHPLAEEREVQGTREGREARRHGPERARAGEGDARGRRQARSPRREPCRASRSRAAPAPPPPRSRPSTSLRSARRSSTWRPRIPSGRASATYSRRRATFDPRACNAAGYEVVDEFIDEPALKPTAHMFVGSKAPWYEILDDLPPAR